MGWWWTFCRRLWIADVFLAAPLSGSQWWRDLLLSLSYNRGSIGHNWLLFEARYWSPWQTLPFHPPPFFFPPAISLRDLAAATLISMVDGVPSSAQTNSWIDRWAQMLSSLCPAQMVENSEWMQPKRLGEREGWQGGSGWHTSEMLRYFSSRDPAHFLFIRLLFRDARCNYEGCDRCAEWQGVRKRKGRIT